MIRAAAVRKLCSPLTTSPLARRSHEQPSQALNTKALNNCEGLVLFCQAQPGFAKRLMGAQTAHDILTNGFEDRHYRCHAKLNGWIAPAEWVERDAVYMTDRPKDPAGVQGEQLEVVLALTERELRQYEMRRSQAAATDYTGETYRKDREFFLPAALLNVWGQLRIISPEEAYAQCSFRIGEAEERARTRARNL